MPFNARIVIGQVIRPVLEEAKEITDGDFPDHQFKAMFPLVEANVRCVRKLRSRSTSVTRRMLLGARCCSSTGATHRITW